MSKKKATGKPVGDMIGARLRKAKLQRRLDYEYHSQKARHLKKITSSLEDRVRQAADETPAAQEERGEKVERKDEA